MEESHKTVRDPRNRLRLELLKAPRWKGPPAKQARRRLRATTAPTAPGRGVAPISAIDRGLNSLSRLRTDILASLFSAHAAGIAWMPN